MSERMVSIAWIAFTSLLGVAGQTVAKVGLSRLALSPSLQASDVGRMLGSPLVWCGGTLLVLGTVLWFHVLSKVEFSVAMPVGSLLQLVLSVAAARVCFGESLPTVRWIGFTLAMVAVWLIASPAPRA